MNFLNSIIQVDIIKYISIPILKKFIVDDDVDLKVIKTISCIFDSDKYIK